MDFYFLVFEHYF